MTTLSELLVRLDLQAETITMLAWGETGYECAKLKCLCNLWAIYKYYNDSIPPDLWIVSAVPKSYDRGLLNLNCLFRRTQLSFNDIVLHYHKWAPHGLDHAVLQEIFK